MRMLKIVSYSDSSADESGDDSSSETDEVKEQPHPKRLLSAESSEDSVGHSSVTKKSRLEIPPALLSMFKDDERHEDDPLKHKGRIRSFQHERGNWATHVYFPVHKDETMEELISDLLSVLPRMPEWHEQDSFHLSVSRTVVLRHHWIDTFVTSLSHAVNHLSTFNCEMGIVKLYTNDDKTRLLKNMALALFSVVIRTFLAIEVVNGVSALKEVVAATDGCLKEFKLQPYYENPSFHISVLWTLGDVISTASMYLKGLQDTLDNHFGRNPTLARVDTQLLEAKCGNKIYTFNLSHSVS